MRARALLLISIAISLFGVATTIRTVSFLSKFSLFWPEMLCYSPEAAVHFEVMSTAPILITVLLLLSGIVSFKLQSSLFDWMLFTLELFAVYLLARIFQLTGYYFNFSHDAGCTTAPPWLEEFPILNILSRPTAGYIVVGVLFL